MAHVLLELMLDKVLIQEAPTLLDEYYAHYQRNVPFTGVSAATEKVAGNPLPHYSDFLQNFLDKRYLANYLQWEHLQYILSRILRRVGVEHIEYIDSPSFVKLMQTYEVRLSQRYQAMFAFLRQAMPQV